MGKHATTKLRIRRRQELWRMLMSKKALDVQIGGDHYKGLEIQPMEYSMRNNLNACQHTAIKYITRYKSKDGKADLEKAVHTIQMLIEMEYPEEPFELNLIHTQLDLFNTPTTRG